MTAHSDFWHILYIDDDEDDFFITRDLLSQSQGRKILVDWAPTFEAGEQKLVEAQDHAARSGSNGHFDAVLVDYDLGARTGIELIRQFSPQVHAPLILYTGRGSHEVDMEAMEAGATLYISKSEVNPLLLERVIRYAIELKQKENELRAANQQLERELTEREKAEEALGKSEEKFAKSFRSSPIAIAISRVSDGTFIDVNDSYLHLYGFTREEMIGHTSVELGLFPDPIERQEVVRRFRETGGFRDMPIQLRRKTGELLDLLFSTERIELGGQECMLSMVVDNTERKRAAVAQHTSEERLRQFIENTHDNFIALDTEWRFTYANQHYCQLMGRACDELIGQNYWELFPKYIGTDLERNYRQVMETGIPFHYRFSGGYTGRTYDISIYRTNEGVVVFSIDRTDETRKEMELEKERALQESVLAALPVGVWIADAGGKIIGKNRAADEIWGGDAPLSKNIEGYREYVARYPESGEIVPPDRWPVAQALITGKTSDPVEMRIQCFDGGERVVMALGAPIKDQDGQLAGAVAINVDITDLKKVEQALRQSEERFRSVLENSIDVAYRRDLRKDQYDYMSPVVEQILGYTVEEMMDMSIDEALAQIHPSDLSQVSEGLMRAVDEGSGRLVYRFRCKDGDYRWLADNVTVTKDASGQPLYRTGILRDITDRIEEQRFLEDSEEKLQLALDAAQMGTWEYDPQSDQLLFGERGQQLYGVGPGWMPRGEALKNIIHEEDLPTLRDSLERVSDPNGPGRYQAQYRVRRPDGSWRWISAWGQMEFVGEGAERRPARMIGAGRDVTEQVLAEQALHESETRFRDLANNMSQLAWTADENGSVFWYNRRWYDYTGAVPGETEGEGWSKVIHPDHLPRLQDIVREHIASGQPWEDTYPLRGKDGQYRWFLSRVQPIKDEQGRVLRWFGTGTDVTEQYLLRRQLEDERTRLEIVLQTLPVGVWVTDASGRILIVNDQVNKIWGGEAPLSESIDQYGEYQAFDAQTGRELQLDEYPIALALRTGQSLPPYELRIRRFDGTEGVVLVSVELIKNPAGEVTGSVAINVDITERKAMEDALRESEQKYQAIFDSAPYSIILARLNDGVIVDVNQAWQYMFEVAREEAVGKTALQLGTIPDPETREKGYQEMKEQGRLRNFEMRFQTRSGTPFLSLNNADVITFKGEKYLLSTTEDITERRHAEEALRESEQKYRELSETLEVERAKLAAVIEALPVGVAVGDMQGNTLSLNRAGLALHDFQSESEMFERLDYYVQEFTLSHSDGSLIPFEDWPVSRAIRGDFVQNLEVILHNLTKGIQKIVAYTATPVHNSAGEVTLVIYTLQDLTELKETERELQANAEKLERSNQALTDFAFIASHDLQEPLRKVQAFGNLLSERFSEPLGTQGKDYIDRISLASARMSEMLQGLLNYSRVTTQGKPFERVDLSQVAREVLSDLEIRIRDTGGQVELGELPVLQADSLQMRQLLQNLIGNALKYHRPDVPPQVSVSGEVEGPLARLQVRDNGIGMKAEDAQRIFQPFVRLHGRAEFEGTGMGLAICQKIAERHGGTITVEGVPGEGSIFTITLPVNHERE